MTNVCEGCSEPFESIRRARACSAVCRVRVWRDEHPEEYREQGRRRHRRRYGSDEVYTAAQRATNAAYKRANRGRCSERERLRKAKVRAGERIDRDELFALHEGRCGICGELIEGAFEVDHRLPLSRGGEHTVSNVQPAHPMCNRRKYNHEESKSL